MNDKPLILLVGKSGSGKTTVAECLEKYFHLKMLESYTTREPRYENERGHIFITQSEYLTLKNKLATTYFNGNYYCCTQEQCDEADVYVIDPHGVKTFERNYKGDRKTVIVYLQIGMWMRFYRMLKRGDGFKKAVGRLWNDYNEFYGFSRKKNVHIIKKNTVYGTAFQINSIRRDV